MTLPGDKTDGWLRARQSSRRDENRQSLALRRPECRAGDEPAGETRIPEVRRFKETSSARGLSEGTRYRRQERTNRVRVHDSRRGRAARASRGASNFIRTAIRSAGEMRFRTN